MDPVPDLPKLRTFSILLVNVSAAWASSTHRGYRRTPNTSESDRGGFLYVSDTHALHHEWREVVVDGRLVPPVDSDYGLVEGAYVDPDDNLLRFGSPLPRPSR